MELKTIHTRLGFGRKWIIAIRLILIELNSKTKLCRFSFVEDKVVGRSWKLIARGTWSSNISWESGNCSENCGIKLENFTSKFVLLFKKLFQFVHVSFLRTTCMMILTNFLWNLSDPARWLCSKIACLVQRRIRTGRCRRSSARWKAARTVASRLLLSTHSGMRVLPTQPFLKNQSYLQFHVLKLLANKTNFKKTSNICASSFLFCVFIGFLFNYPCRAINILFTFQTPPANFATNLLTWAQAKFEMEESTFGNL